MIGRIKAAWHVLRGKPTAYRLRLNRPMVLDPTEDLLVYECRVSGADQPQMSITWGTPTAEASPLT